MLGGILAPRAVGNAAATDHGLEAVGLKQEAKLRGERLGERSESMGLMPCSRVMPPV
jgi:hypothetical protein